MPCSDELNSNSSSSDEFDSTSSSFANSSNSVEKIVSNKGMSKELHKWYEDETDDEEDQTDEIDDEEDQTDETDHDDEEELWTPTSKGITSKSIPTPKNKRKALWTPKSKGTTGKSLPTAKSKGKALLTPKIPQTPKKFVVKSSIPIRNCCIGLANKLTWEMIVNKTFGVLKQEKDHVEMGKRKLGQVRGQQYGRSYGFSSQLENSNQTSIPTCNQYGKHHPGDTYYGTTSVCFICGQCGHLAKHRGKNRGVSNTGNGNNRQHTTWGRVFVLTTDHAANSPGTVSGTLYMYDRDVFVLFDTRSTHYVVSLAFSKQLKVSSTPFNHALSISTPMGNIVIIGCEFKKFLVTYW
ncbi:hypothetical protein Tco_1510554 [Tanacetum coccineum]